MTDRERIELLRQDPERGMEEIVAEHTGLLWAVAARLLQETEDIKDCVNGTFAEFFYHQERYDPEKGSLKAYLAVITKRLAFKQYQANQQQSATDVETLDETGDAFLRLEQREELEAALTALEPVDQQIIRMKYYDGMTAKEIAASLGLPYETVKKRHQRSLKKMKKYLTTGLLVLLVGALLAACGYLVLRYFGVVPGYGVNTDPDQAFYILEQGGTVQTERYRITVTDGWWHDEVLILDAQVFYADVEVNYMQIPDWETGEMEKVFSPMAPQLQVQGADGIEHIQSISEQITETDRQQRFVFAGDLPEDAGETLTLRLICDGASLELSVQRSARELSLDEAGYYHMTEEGGLLAIPRLENGELIVSVYPLNVGAYQTDVGLVMGPWSSFGGPTAPVTVTTMDGTVLTGRPVNYRPCSGEASMDWNFGPAVAGEYTLTVPYVYQTTAEGEMVQQEFVLSQELCDLALEIPVPGGTVSLERLIPAEYVERVTCGEDIRIFPEDPYAGYHWWSLQSRWIPEDEERVLAAVPLSLSYVQAAESSDSVYMDLDLVIHSRTVTDESGGSYAALEEYRVVSAHPDQAVVVRLIPSQICYRWNHTFTIPFQVSE